MRKKFLVKPQLQIKYLALITGAVIISFVASYFILESALSPLLGKNPEIADQWLALKGSLRGSMAIILGILVIAIGIEHYFFFHGIAGPIYALEKQIKRITDGQYNEQTIIRESDQLGDLVKAFEEMRIKISATNQKQEEKVGLLLNELEKILVDTSTPNLNMLRNKMKALREEVNKKAA